VSSLRTKKGRIEWRKEGEGRQEKRREYKGRERKRWGGDRKGEEEKEGKGEERMEGKGRKGIIDEGEVRKLFTVTHSSLWDSGQTAN
jgi:hypothetical protein